MSCQGRVRLTRPGFDSEQALQRFGGHCLRVSGAQYLTRRGVPPAAIMHLGRWGSQSVMRHIQDSCLDQVPLALAADSAAPPEQSKGAGER